MGLDRASPGDLLNLAVDRGSVPMNIGAVLTFDPSTRPAAAEVEALLSERVPQVPRLTRRLVGAPPGCGRPVWVADPGFATVRHLDRRAARSPGDVGRAATQGMELLLRRLPRDRPLWAARVLTDEEGRASDLIVVLHHALADGIGGLAVLAALADDPASDSVTDTRPEPLPTPVQVRSGPPTARELAGDAWAERARAVGSLPDRVLGLRAGMHELTNGPPRLSGRTTLLAPTSPYRDVDVVDVALAPVVATAHAARATVNDLVVVSVVRALGALLEERVDPLDPLVVSMPVSSRGGTTADELGNRVGVLPVAVPVRASRDDQLAAIAAQRARLGAGRRRGSSGAALAATFRTLAALRLFQPFVNRQRLVHTFVTNVRGPSEPVHLAGAQIVRVVPLTTTPGNVTVSFDVLSVAGRLVVAVVSDPDHVPEHGRLRDALQRELLADGQAGPLH